MASDPSVYDARLQPPVADRRPRVASFHGLALTDDYAWLKDENWQQVIKDPSRLNPEIRWHLEAENAYADAVMEPLRPLQDKLYDEIVSRIQETDLSVPVPHGPWLYYSRSVEGLQYGIHCRRAPEDGSAEQVLIDENKNPRLLLDFATADHLSSAALGMLININNRVRQKNGQLRLANIKPQILEVFVITKLNKLFKILPTRTEALANFAHH